MLKRSVSLLIANFFVISILSLNFFAKNVEFDENMSNQSAGAAEFYGNLLNADSKVIYDSLKNRDIKDISSNRKIQTSQEFNKNNVKSDEIFTALNLDFPEKFYFRSDSKIRFLGSNGQIYLKSDENGEKYAENAQDWLDEFPKIFSEPYENLSGYYKFLKDEHRNLSDKSKSFKAYADNIGYETILVQENNGEIICLTFINSWYVTDFNGEKLLCGANEFTNSYISETLGITLSANGYLEDNCAAKSDGKPFATVDEALANVKDGGEISVNEDFTLNRLNMPKKSCTISGNSHNVTLEGEITAENPVNFSDANLVLEYAFQLNSNGNVTFENSEITVNSNSRLTIDGAINGCAALNFVGEMPQKITLVSGVDDSVNAENLPFKAAGYTYEKIGSELIAEKKTATENPIPPPIAPPIPQPVPEKKTNSKADDNAKIIGSDLVFSQFPLINQFDLAAGESVFAEIEEIK
ncbi:MAG: hypothetical protein RR540_03950 [Oscillospiraceae bacterium]